MIKNIGKKITKEIFLYFYNSIMQHINRNSFYDEGDDINLWSHRNMMVHNKEQIVFYIKMYKIQKDIKKEKKIRME